jgi:hypothetical protein
MLSSRLQNPPHASLAVGFAAADGKRYVIHGTLFPELNNSKRERNSGIGVRPAIQTAGATPFSLATIADKKLCGAFLSGWDEKIWDNVTK